MARTMGRFLPQDFNGRFIGNALVLLRETDGVTMLAGAWDAPSGGNAVTQVVTDSQGEAIFWLDLPRAINLIVTDNSDTAYLLNNPSVTISFPDSTPELLNVGLPASAISHGGGTVEGVLDGLGDDSGWILPTLNAPDVTALTSFTHLGYRKVGKLVTLHIALSIANAAAGKLLFTLPAGYRPTAQGGSACAFSANAAGYGVSAVLVRGDTGAVNVGPASTVVLATLSFLVP